MEKDYEVNYIEISNPGNNLSESHFKDFFGRVVKDGDGNLLDGEYQFAEYPYAIIRFHEGMIDGNIYDQYGDIIERFPALIYQSDWTSCREYWTKGFPDGNPAINFDFGEYEEYWKDKQLVYIKHEQDWFNTSQEQFSYKYIFEEKGESLIKSIVYVDDMDDYDGYDYFEDEYNYDDHNFDDYNKNWSDPPSEINEEKEIDKILSFDNYLTFKERLFQIMKIRRIKKTSELYNKINMHPKTFSNVIKAKALVSYNNAILLALGLKLTFEQMKKFVNFAIKGFGHDPQRDKFVREAFEKKDYSIYKLNKKLRNKGLSPFLIQKEKTQTSTENSSIVDEYYIEISNPGNNASLSHFKDFFGRVVKDNKGKELDGEYQFGEYPYAIIRFHEGMIDGNIYDQYGDIIERFPALIYQSDYSECKEYWTKGFPDGNPAIEIDFVFGPYTECWKDKQLISIRKVHDWDERSEQFTHKFLFEEKSESIIKSIVSYDDCEYFGYDTIEYEYNYDDYNYDNYNKKWREASSIINEEKEVDKILSFDNNFSFQERLLKIIEQRRLTAPKVYDEIGMSQQTFNNVKNGDLVSYNNAVVLAFGLKLSFEQMIKFVHFARKGFGCNPQQDKFVKEAFKNKDYSIYKLNKKIYEASEKNKGKEINLFL